MTNPLRDDRWIGACVVAALLVVVTVGDAAGAERARRSGNAQSASGEGSDARSKGTNAAVNPPRSVFDCDTPRGEDWYGSAERCLQEMCAGGNFTNQYVDGPGHQLRKNPCYGRDPYELQR